MFSFIQLQADTIANAASNVVIEKIVLNTEISTLGFLLKGGIWLIPIGILLFYTFMSLLNGICISVKPLR
jgi:biopolymer transport protein ExbB